jgi:hypothetical protein
MGDKYKGHSGFLLTTRVQLVRSDGLVGPQVPWPGGALRFEKMIDEHTAIYSVLTGRYEVSPDTQIAVELPGSNPPTSTKLWRVYVEGSDDFENGLGATVQLAKVKFEGYAEPPAPQHEQLPGPSIAATQTNAVAPAYTVSADASSGHPVSTESSDPSSIPVDLRGPQEKIIESGTRVRPSLTSVPSNGSSVSLSILSNTQGTNVIPMWKNS